MDEQELTQTIASLQDSGLSIADIAARLELPPLKIFRLAQAIPTAGKKEKLKQQVRCDSFLVNKIMEQGGRVYLEASGAYVVAVGKRKKLEDFAAWLAEESIVQKKFKRWKKGFIYVSHPYEWLVRQYRKRYPIGMGKPVDTDESILNEIVLSDEAKGWLLEFLDRWGSWQKRGDGVFLSFSHQDEEYIQHIADLLKEKMGIEGRFKQYSSEDRYPYFRFTSRVYHGELAKWVLNCSHNRERKLKKVEKHC